MQRYFSYICDGTNVKADCLLKTYIQAMDLWSAKNKQLGVNLCLKISFNSVAKQKVTNKKNPKNLADYWPNAATPVQ